MMPPNRSGLACCHAASGSGGALGARLGSPTRQQPAVSLTKLRSEKEQKKHSEFPQALSLPAHLLGELLCLRG